MELAIFADSKTLLDRFVAIENCSFCAFCDVWKSMKFQHIYSAQSSNIELLQTTAAVLHVAKRIACGRDTNGSTNQNKYADDHNKQLHYRIGGIYLMYAIYFKQPLRHYVKVEMALETWREFKAFICALPMTVEMDEVRFVFWKLMQADAFRFTALDYCVGLEGLVDFDKLDEEALEAHAQEKGTKLKQELYCLSATQRLLPALTVLEDGYNEMKELLATADKKTHANSLPPTTIFNSINETFRNIQKILDEPKVVKSNIENSRTMDVESKRRNLKRKGYKTGKQSERPAEDDDTELDEETNITEEPEKSKTKHYRRMSARTVFAEQLPAELLADLQDQSESEAEAENDDESIHLEDDTEQFKVERI